METNYQHVVRCIHLSDSAFLTLSFTGTLLDMTTNNPAMDGFNSGVDKDGLTLFPGIADFNTCGGLRPGRVYKNPIGANTVCSNADLFTSRSVRYYVRHSNLKWMPATFPSINSIPGVIAVSYPEGGSHFVTRHDLGSYEQIGVFYTVTQQLFYWNGTSQVTETSLDAVSEFEVLACQDDSQGNEIKKFVSISSQLYFSNLQES